jgi:hypothetical protein
MQVGDDDRSSSPRNGNQNKISFIVRRVPPIHFKKLFSSPRSKEMMIVAASRILLYISSSNRPTCTGLEMLRKTETHSMDFLSTDTRLVPTYRYHGTDISSSSPEVLRNSFHCNGNTFVEPSVVVAVVGLSISSSSSSLSTSPPTLYSRSSSSSFSTTGSVVVMASKKAFEPSS